MLGAPLISLSVSLSRTNEMLARDVDQRSRGVSVCAAWFTDEER